MATPRMGIEVEYQRMSMTFRRTTPHLTDPSDYWPELGNGHYDETLIAHNPILVPALQLDGEHWDSIENINWQSNFGFIVVGDSFGYDHHPALKLDGSRPLTGYGQCVFECNSSANFINLPHHWVFLRLCLQKFKETLYEYRWNQSNSLPKAKVLMGLPSDATQRVWYPLEDFVAKYNMKVNSIQIPDGAGIDKRRYQLALSPFMKALAKGEYARPGAHAREQGSWEAWIQVEDDLRTHTQVNYQANLGNLYSSLDSWLNLWNHMWLERNPLNPTAPVLDRPSGSQVPSSRDITYRNQACVAMWRLARTKADQLVNNLHLVADPKAVAQTKALVMLVLAMASVIPQDAGGHFKNSWSQFSKTAPHAIADAIRAAWNLDLRPVANIAPDILRQAATDLRNRHTLATIPNGLPAGRPIPTTVNEPIQTYDAYNYSILGPQPPVYPAVHLSFLALWQSVFTNIERPQALAEANLFGYTNNSPFFCWWSLGAHTSSRPITTDSSDIFILFESRYERNRLNMGFDPTVTDLWFYSRYLQLVENVLGQDARTTAAGVLDSYGVLFGTATERQLLVTQLDAAQGTLGIH